MERAVTAATADKNRKLAGARTETFRYILRNRALYIMLLPGLLFFLIFKYIPLLGSVIAFQDYNVFEGFANSPWVGFRNFEQLFTYPNFTRILVNTIVISLYQIIFAFPAPIILALLLNELRHIGLKRWAQTIVYLPHFLSWTIVYGLVFMMLSLRTGMINQLVTAAGGEAINFLQEPGMIRAIIVSSGVWKEMGWSAIIFLAALAGISPSLYEAAKIDGANRWHQFLHISLPGLIPAMVILLLLKIGHILDSGFENVFVFLNPITYPVADVIDTFTYRAGIQQGQYSFTTAIGLFKSVVGFLLLVIANRASKAITGEGLY